VSLATRFTVLFVVQLTFICKLVALGFRNSSDELYLYYCLNLMTYKEHQQQGYIESAMIRVEIHFG